MSLPSEATTPMSRIHGVLDTDESNRLIATALRNVNRSRGNTGLSEGEAPAFRMESSSRSLNKSVNVVPPAAGNSTQFQQIQKRSDSAQNPENSVRSSLAGVVDEKVESEVCSSAGDEASLIHSTPRHSQNLLKRASTNVPGWFSSQLEYTHSELQPVNRSTGQQSQSQSQSPQPQIPTKMTTDKSVATVGLQSPSPPSKSFPFDIPKPDSPATKADTAKDLEQHTKLIHSLWADLKQWRAETKTIDPGAGEGAAILLGLRHMAFQINQLREAGKLQLAIAYKMCSLAAECGQVVPQTEPISSALRGERYNMSRTINSLEDGYGDDCSFENPSATDLTNNIKFDEQGDLTLSVSALLKACQNNTQTTSSPNLVTAIERQRKEMASEIESLTQMVADIREREELSRIQHHERVQQLISKVSDVSGERDALLEAKKQHREKTDIYEQAFSEYRKNMDDMRHRLDALTKENYQLRRERASQFTTQKREPIPSTTATASSRQPMMPSSTLCDSIMNSTPVKGRTSRGSYKNSYSEDESPVLVVATREESVGRDVPPDTEFEAFSFEIENRLTSLGKLASPEIAAVQSLSPDFGIADGDGVRSLSPSRYLPPTPQVPPPEYDPSIRPPFAT